MPTLCVSLCIERAGRSLAQSAVWHQTTRETHIARCCYRTLRTRDLLMSLRLEVVVIKWDWLAGKKDKFTKLIYDKREKLDRWTAIIVLLDFMNIQHQKVLWRIGTVSQSGATTLHSAINLPCFRNLGLSYLCSLQEGESLGTSWHEDTYPLYTESWRWGGRGIKGYSGATLLAI